MNCTYSEDRMSDYLENTLSAEERLVVDQHLSTCAVCSELMMGVRDVIALSRSVQAPEAPVWLASRIVANTPRVVRITWTDWAWSVWKTIAEPRFAATVVTSILVLLWVGNATGLRAADLAMIRQPMTVYEGVEGWVQRVYGDAVRRVYSSQIVNTIQCQIHSGIGRFRENT